MPRNCIILFTLWAQRVDRRGFAETAGCSDKTQFSRSARPVLWSSARFETRYDESGAILYAAKMSELVQIDTQLSKSNTVTWAPVGRSSTVFWLQGITLMWMLVECGLSLYAAAAAQSPAMLAFGSDSFVELLSAGVVLLQFLPQFSISERVAARAAGALLFALAFIVCVMATVSLALRLRPETSRLGIGITVAALIVMPIFAGLKRREARRSNNPALAADAVQSATCAYLAAIALAGLLINALFHIARFDSLAALVALPLLLKEGRAAWHGKTCGCC
jgi:hypothetical protein